jgi:trafficking protein particle complex subunit 11
MDGYAPAYVAHNVPLLVVSGLDSAPQDKSIAPEGAIQIASEIPPVESEDAQVLLRHFKDSDAGELAWNAREYSGRNKFRVKTVGRVVSADSVIILSSH